MLKCSNEINEGFSMSKQRKLVIVSIGMIFVISLIGNLFFSIYTNNIEKSSYTDWISAFCNLIMAGATVAAVLTARNYLAQFTAQEGYKEAIILVNNIMPKVILNLNSIQNSYDRIGNFLSELNDTSNLYKDSLDRTINLLDSSTGILADVFIEMRTYLSNISTYGLQMEEERINGLKVSMDFLEKNDEIMWNYIESIRKYLEWLEKSTEIYEEGIEGTFIFKGRSIDIVDKQNPTFIDIYKTTQEMIEGSSAALEAFKTVIAEPRHITKIFKV